MARRRYCRSEGAWSKRVVWIESCEVDMSPCRVIDQHVTPGGEPPRRARSLPWAAPHSAARFARFTLKYTDKIMRAPTAWGTNVAKHIWYRREHASLLLGGRDLGDGAARAKAAQSTMRYPQRALR